MKRSTDNILYVSPSDFDLILEGKKTATSRLGDRNQVWEIGQSILIKSNEDNRAVQGRIIDMELRQLCDISPEEAWAIGNYSIKDHFNDFINIYTDSDENSILTVVWFKI